MVATTTGASLATKGSMAMNTLYIPVVGVFTYLNLSWESLTLLACLLAMDFITGIGKAYVIDRTKIKSNIALVGIIAKSSILLIPIAFSIAGKQVGYDLSTYTNAIVTMLCLAELYSVIGNIRSIQQT